MYLPGLAIAYEVILAFAELSHLGNGTRTETEREISPEAARLLIQLWPDLGENPGNEFVTQLKFKSNKIVEFLVGYYHF